MNKLLTKIVGLSLGLSMAIGVGVAVAATKSNPAEPVEAADSLVYTLQPASGSNNSYDNNCDIVIGGITWNLTGNSQQIPWRIGGKSLTSVDRTLYSKTAISDNVNKIIVTHGTANSATVNSWTLIVSKNADFSSPVSTLTPSFVASDSTEIDRPSGKDWSNCYYKFIYNITISATKNKYLEFTKAEFYKEASGSVTEVTVEAGALIGSYVTDAYIQCSAKADGTVTNDVTWSINSTNTYVAEQTSVTGASIDSSGKVSFTGAVDVYAFATSTITTTVHGSALCSGSSLSSLIRYVKVDKTSRLSAGTKVIILNSAGTKALSVTQNTNNRADTAVTVDTSGDNPVVDIAPTKVQELTLVAGVESGFNFSYDDGGTTKYLYANGTGGNNYLKTGTSRYADSTDFAITVVDGSCSIALANSSYNGIMQHNSSASAFACYASASQQAVSIFMEGSSLPTDEPLTSIYDASGSNVEVGSSATVTASYLPTNATENIVVSQSGVGSVVIGAVSMSGGTVSFSIEGDSTGSVTLTLVGETTTSATTSVTISVTSYTPTHTKVTSSSGLYNGMKVILGNSEVALASGHHTGGNNMPTVTGSFSEDGSSLSNAAGTACEYTLWQLTIADSEENDVTGWAFYDNGHYLTCATGSNNHWKQTLELTSLCLFDITISDGDTSIVCADTHVARGTICINGSIISAYSALGTYKPVDLYVKESSSEQAMAAGYEDFLLMMDLPDMASHGYCTSKHWYDFAKQEWNTTAFVNCRQYVSSDGKERLHDWAVANGDDYDGGNGALSAAVAPTIFDSITKDSTAVTVIVIISVLSVSAIGGFFFLRKRKEQ